MPDYWEEWTHLGLGAALLASPWIVGYSTAMIATANAVLCGLLLMLLATLALLRERHYPHLGRTTTSH